jgi:hypothetical protein
VSWCPSFVLVIELNFRDCVGVNSCQLQAWCRNSVAFSLLLLWGFEFGIAVSLAPQCLAQISRLQTKRVLENKGSHFILPSTVTLSHRERRERESATPCDIGCDKEASWFQTTFSTFYVRNKWGLKLWELYVNKAYVYIYNLRVMLNVRMLFARSN